MKSGLVSSFNDISSFEGCLIPRQSLFMNRSGIV